jgi:lipid-binding SYLF domain-containing protein
LADPVTTAACTAVSRGLLDLKGFDNSGRWWLGASVALAAVGFTADAEVSSDSDMASLWKKMHAEGKV